LSGVPNAYAPIGTSRDELRSTKLSSLTTDAINLVSHVRVSLDIELLDSTLDIIDDQLSFVVDCGDVANTDRRRFKSPVLYSELLLPLGKQL